MALVIPPFDASIFNAEQKVSSSQMKAPNTMAGSSSIFSRMKHFAGRVSMALGFTAATAMAAPGPVAPGVDSSQGQVIASQVSVPKSMDVKTVMVAPPPKTAIVPEKKEAPIEPVSIKTKLRIATAQNGESVGFFMLKNFGTQDGWEFLVEKETGNRVRVATRDLRAGKTYVLARNEQEASSVSDILKNQSTKKQIDKKLESKEMSPLIPKQKTEKKTSLSPNYFAVPEVTLYAIGKSKGLSLEHIQKSMILAAAIGQHESSTRYDARGITINNKKSTHHGTKAFGRYQVMENNLNSWSLKHFNTVLPFTPENQDKIAFAEMTERVAVHTRKGGDFSSVVCEVAKDWYGRGRAMAGQPTTAEYSRSIVHLFNKFSPNFKVVTASTDGIEPVAQVQHETVKEKIPVSRTIETPKIAASLRSTQAPEKPRTMLATASANDQRFDEEMQKTSIRVAAVDGVQLPMESQAIEKKSSETSSVSELPKTVEFIPVGEVDNIVQGIEQKYKAEVMDRLRNDETIRKDVRESVLEKLEQVTDFAAYYRKNIAQRESEAKRGSAYAKQVLPNLYKLLRDVESKTLSGNDSSAFAKRAA